jgi:hypothetical protein
MTGENHGHDYELARIVRDLRLALVWYVVRCGLVAAYGRFGSTRGAICKTVGAHSRMKTVQCSIALNREDGSVRLF